MSLVQKHSKCGQKTSNTKNINVCHKAERTAHQRDDEQNSEKLAAEDKNHRLCSKIFLYNKSVLFEKYSEV